jgi:hypothetical protein
MIELDTSKQMESARKAMNSTCVRDVQGKDIDDKTITPAPAA